MAIIDTLPAAVKSAITLLKTKWGVTVTEEMLQKEIEQEGMINESNPTGGLKDSSGNWFRPDAGGVNQEAQKNIDLLLKDLNNKYSTGTYICSNYRGYTTQVDNFGKKVKNDGRSVADVQASNTIPGFSQHHTGKCFDILSTDTAWWDARPNVKQWVADNCKNYGFVVTYPVKGPLRIAEPWHLFYIGKNATPPQNTNTLETSGTSGTSGASGPSASVSKSPTYITVYPTEFDPEIVFTFNVETPNYLVNVVGTGSTGSTTGLTTSIGTFSIVTIKAEFDFNWEGDEVVSLLDEEYIEEEFSGEEYETINVSDPAALAKLQREYEEKRIEATQNASKEGEPGEEAEKSGPMLKGPISISNGGGLKKSVDGFSIHHSFTKERKFGSRRVGYRNSGFREWFRAYLDSDDKKVFFDDCSAYNHVVYDLTILQNGASQPVAIRAPFDCKVIKAWGNPNSGIALLGTGDAKGKTAVFLHVLPSTHNTSKAKSHSSTVANKLISECQGKEYRKGEVMAYQGNWGEYSTGTHLHVECMLKADFDKYMTEMPSFYT
jgi:hypothetical protein